MGIRFYCPNGHKLNVKEFQAGRRGICPYCAQKFLVPAQSTRPSSKSQKATKQSSSSDVGAESEEQLLEAEPPAPTAAALAKQAASRQSAGPVGQAMRGDFSGPPATPPQQPAPGAPPPIAYQPPTPAASNPPSQVSARTSGPPGGASRDTPVNLMSAYAPPASGPMVPAPPPPPPLPAQQQEPPDPIAEAPDMIWYVRPPSGGQFGPATADIMRNWLTEGRVGTDSLVWREGWRDWQEAGDVFPQLRPGAAFGLFSPENIDPLSSNSHGQAQRLKARRHSDGTQFTIVLMLSIAVVVLSGVFVYVLFYQ